jgi:hypothetical protein
LRELLRPLEPVVRYGFKITFRMVRHDHENDRTTC